MVAANLCDTHCPLTLVIGQEYQQKGGFLKPLLAIPLGIVGLERAYRAAAVCPKHSSSINEWHPDTPCLEEAQQRAKRITRANMPSAVSNKLSYLTFKDDEKS